MTEDPAERMNRLEARIAAQGLLLKSYFKMTIPDAEMRSELCRKITGGIDGLYRDDRVTEVGHPHFQVLISEIERILGPFSPKPDPG